MGRMAQQFQNLSDCFRSEEIQIAQLLHFAGPKIQKIHSTFTFTQEEENKIRRSHKKIQCTFHTMRQAEEITTEQFITDLRRHAKVCSFGDLHDELIKLMLICGTNNGEIRQRLLQEEEADLQKAIKTGNIIEESKTQAKWMNNQAPRQATTPIDRITTKSRSNSPGNRDQASRQRRRFQGSKGRTTDQNRSNSSS
jgi:hypothetical protein